MNLPEPQPPDGIELLAQLQRAGAVSSKGLHLPPNLPWHQYESLAVMFGQLHRTSSWLIGDLLNYGEKVYGETYVQAAALTGLSEHTCMNIASVCKYVPYQRRRDELSFSVHAEVAYKEPHEQTEWLGQAAKNRWTRQQLRLAMKGELPVQAAGSAPIEILPPAGVAVTTCPNCGHSF